MPSILYVFLIVLSLIWGFSFYFIKVLLEFVGPWGVAFTRCAFGAITLAAVVLWRWSSYKGRRIPWWTIAWIGIINTAVPWALIGYSETTLDSGLVSILNAATPVWTLLIGILFFQVRSSLGVWIGLLLGFVGILTLMNIDWTSMHVQDHWGFIAMIGTAIGYGFGSQFAKRKLQEVPVVLIAFVSLLSSALFCSVMMLVTESVPSVSHLTEATFLIAAVGLGCFGSGIAYLMFYALIQRSSAEFATLVTYLVPVFALFLGAWLLDESLSWTMAGGFLLIILGVYVTGRYRAQLSKREGGA